MKIFALMFRMWKVVLPLFLLLGILLYTRLPSRNEPAVPLPGDQVTIPEGMRVRIVCSNECRELAQCGRLQQTPDNMVVLGDTFQPNLTEHNTTIPQSTIATVLAIGQRQVREQRWVGELSETGIQQEFKDVNFYLLNFDPVTGQLPAWVAGWCVQTIPE